MLLEFRTKNFKSFKDELVFSMVKAPKQKGLDYSILKTKIGSKEYQGLSSAVIYGPNASGKTNIISAMGVFRKIILRGHINNIQLTSKSNPAEDSLELIPNQFSENGTPVHFSMKFVINKLMFKYSLVADLGTFLDDDYKRKIISETLELNESLVFSRSDSLEFGDLNGLKPYVFKGFEGLEEKLVSLANINLNSTELFLMNGFKAMFSPQLSDIIKNWMENKLMVFCRSDILESSPTNLKNSTIHFSKNLNAITEAFGVNANPIGYYTNDDPSDSRLVSILESDGGKIPIPAEIFESYGTIRIVNIYPFILTALANGGTLVIDEFDASLHPMVLMNIVNIFHNDELNKNKAQLIFNTHNPIFLNSNLFRRDEIKFVERDESSPFNSTHYSLSDFGTSGQSGVRDGSGYMKNYFINHYGAIKNIDLSSVFEKLLESRGELKMKVPIRKEKREFYFSVAGQTEKLYLDWLQETINKDTQSKYIVIINSIVENSPIKFLKRATITTKTVITHWFDYESHEPKHEKEFYKTLDLLVEAEKKGKQIKYKMGYSNFTFDLWMILHKESCNGHIEHRSRYVRNINRAFDEKFAKLDDYKVEKNFKRILNKISLDDVRYAVKQAKGIMNHNETNGLKTKEYKGHIFYLDNPSLNIHESIENILVLCELMKK